MMDWAMVRVIVYDVFEVALEPFRHEVTAFILAAVILAGGAWLLYRLRRQMAAPERSIKAATRIVSEAEGPESFATKFEEINHTLGRDPVLGPAWREFSETLIAPSDGQGRISNTARPQHFFNEDLLVAARVNLPVFQAVPNYLVGAGLFFTFIGLVAALHFAGKGVASDSVQEAQQALKDLLQAATFKFVTSIAGLGMSIYFSVRKKRLLHHFHVLVDRFCEALDKRLDIITPVGVAERSYRELRDQTAQLQRFNTDLAMSIAEALDQKIAVSFGNAVAPVAQAIEQMAARMGQMNEDALRSMISDFTRVIEDGAGR